MQKALDADIMNLVFTNSNPTLPAWGGKSMLLEVFSLACGALRKENQSILDMAPSIAARGKIYKAKRRAGQIHADWSLDNDGKPTTDPVTALDGGVMLPMRGAKGLGLAVMTDLSSGALSGSAFAGHVTGPVR